MTLDKNHNGNALFVVLVAIVLFAALGLAVTRTSSSSTSSDQQAANLQADEMIKWAASVKTAVNTMMLVNDTSDISVDFQDPRPGQSGTPTQPTNTRNPNSRGAIDSVFSISGDGGPAVWRDFSPNTPGLYTTFFTGQYAFENTGTAAADLAYFVRDIHVNLCRAINRKAGLGMTDETMPEHTGPLAAAHFKGTYGTDTISDTGGRDFGCILQPGAVPEYWFFYIIIAR